MSKTIGQSKVIQIIRCILYELQPIRYIDLVYYWKELFILLKFVLELFNEYVIRNIISMLNNFSKNPFLLLVIVKNYYPFFIWLVGWYFFIYIEFGQV